jgi:hypothetical protein
VSWKQVGTYFRRHDKVELWAGEVDGTWWARRAKGHGGAVVTFVEAADEVEARQKIDQLWPLQPRKARRRKRR